jgi:hypothetical protein
MKKSLLYRFFQKPRNIDEFLDKVQKESNKEVSLTVYTTFEPDIEGVDNYLGIFLESGKHKYNSSVSYSLSAIGTLASASQGLKSSAEAIGKSLSEHLKQRGFNVFWKIDEKNSHGRICEHDRELIKELLENKN